MQDVPPTKHPYRDTAMIYGVLAVLIVVFAWATGGGVLRAVLIAAAAWVVATAWSMVRWRRRLQAQSHERGER